MNKPSDDFDEFMKLFPERVDPLAPSKGIANAIALAVIFFGLCGFAVFLGRTFLGW